MASGSSSIMCRGRGCWDSASVGWVERSDTHRVSATGLMGIAALHPSNALVVQRCLMQIARIKIQLLSSCHALLGSEHCSRAPLRKK